MAYIGNAPPSFFTSVAVDVFSGNASNTAFTLSKSITSTTDIEVVVDNIQQNPFSGSYSVNGTTLTFSSAPASGSNNVVVAYRQATIGSTVASANSVSSSSLQPNSVSSSSLQPNLSLSGNVNFSSTGARITGDFNNATISNRLFFQSSTTNGSTSFGVLPNGTSLVSGYQAYNNSDPTNAAFAQLATSAGTEVRLTSGITGTGTYLPMTFYTNGSERMRIDTSGNVGIGTASPSTYGKFAVFGANQTNILTASSSDTSFQVYTDISVGEIRLKAVDTSGANNSKYMTFYTQPSGSAALERMRIDSSGNLLFNSGYGSAAIAYGCRAWVNFNGTSTVAIRASGNVSSITDNGTGDYTVNFTTAMPDANYSPVATIKPTAAASSTNGKVVNIRYDTNLATSSCRLWCNSTGGAEDMDVVAVSIFR